MARTTLLLWRRGLAGSLSVRDGTVVGLVVGFLVFTGGLGVVLYWILSQFFSSINPAMYHGDARALLRLVLAGVLSGTLVLMTVLSASAPERTTLDTLLRLLPVRRSARTIGTLAPLLAAGFPFALAVGFPSLAVIFQLSSSGAVSAGPVLGFLWLTLWSSVAWPALFFLARACGGILKLPAHYSLVFATAITVSVGALLLGGDLVPVQRISGEAWWAAVTPTRAIVDLLVPSAGSTALAWTSVCVWSVVAAGLVWAVAHVGGRTQEKPSTGLLIGIDFPGSRFGARVWLEILVILRLPQFLVTALVMVVGTAALWILYPDPRFTATVDQLAGLVVVVAAALGIHSFGSTRPWHWITRSLTGRPRSWAPPKVIATAAVFLLLIAPYAVSLVAVGFSSTRFWDIVSLGGVMVACALVLGILIPCVPAQGLSATITSAATTILWATVVVISRWVAGSMGWDTTLGTVIGMAAVLALIPLVVRGERGSSASTA